MCLGTYTAVANPSYEDPVLYLGTAEEVLAHRHRPEKCNLQVTGTTSRLPYAMSEILTLKFGSVVDVTNLRTIEAQLFADLVKYILDSSGLTRLLWGPVIETPDRVKVILDWQTENAHESLHSSQQYRDRLTRLETRCTVSACFQTLQIGDSWTREACFKPSFSFFCGAGQPPYTTAIYTWRLPKETEIKLTDDWEVVSPDTQNKSPNTPASSTAWNIQWTNFAMHSYRRLQTPWGGGVVRASAGTSAETDTFIGILGVETLERSLQTLYAARNLDYLDGGIKKMLQLVDDDLEVLHVRFTVLDRGWNNSITNRGPGRADGLFSDVKEGGSLFGSPGSNAPRPTSLFGVGPIHRTIQEKTGTIKFPKADPQSTQITQKISGNGSTTTSNHPPVPTKAENIILHSPTKESIEEIRLQHRSPGGLDINTPDPKLGDKYENGLKPFPSPLTVACGLSAPPAICTTNL